MIAVILQSRLADATTTAAEAFSTAFWWTFALSAVALLPVAFLPSRRAEL